MFSQFKIIKQFIECFDNPKELKDFMEVVRDAAFTSPIADEWNADFRGDVLFYFKQISLLLDAIFVVAKPIINLFELFHKSNIDEKI